MKIKLLTTLVLLGGLFGVTSFVSAMYSESTARTTTTRSANFQAKLDNGNVKMSWKQFAGGDNFQYYKIIRSQTKTNPVYPEDGYIKYDSNRSFTAYTDTDAPTGTTYYRVCAILGGQKRYCSAVVKLVIKGDQTQTTNNQSEDTEDKEKDTSVDQKSETKTTTASSPAVDAIANAFITQLNAKYGSDQASKNKVIDSVVIQLDALAKQKPVLKTIIGQLKVKLLAEKDDLLDIQNILKVQ